MSTDKIKVVDALISTFQSGIEDDEVVDAYTKVLEQLNIDMETQGFKPSAELDAAVENLFAKIEELEEEWEEDEDEDEEEEL